EGEGEGRSLAFRLNTGDLVVAGPDHPLRFEEGEDGPHPYVEVRSGLDALVARPVYYELAELALAEAAEPAGLWSGGRFFALEPEDDGPVGAALREAEEEIGLPPASVEVIGIADTYRTITGFEVTPVVGVVPPDLPLSPHPGEVASMFEAPLDWLLDPERQTIR